MRKLMAAVLCVPLSAAMIVPAWGQYGRDQRGDQYNRDQRGDQYNRDQRGYQYNAEQHRQFYNGAYQGGRDGDYYGNDRSDRYREYDQRYHGDGGYYHQGGIGPGKGALIGGAGGAVLGGIFGGGAKGAIIGGAAGAGIGAILGEAHQNNERRDDYRH
jgi:hypothetical protein